VKIEDIIMFKKFFSAPELTTPNPVRMHDSDDGVVVDNEPIAAPKLKMNKSSNQLAWEQSYSNVFGIVVDDEGKLIEIRNSRKGKQLAFWDHEKNKKINVYKNPQNAEEIIMPNKEALIITTMAQP